MKRFGLLFISLGFALASIAQKKQTYNAAYIDKVMLPVRGNVYASKYECSNAEYRKFIESLIAKRDFETLAYAECDSIMWGIQEVMNIPFIQYYHKHEAYANHPVVNISYKAAQAYCTWLTETYNNAPKRKFRKVVFRLPTGYEWTLAATNGQPDSKRLFAVAGPGLSLRLNDKPLANYTVIKDELIIKDERGTYFVNEPNKMPNVPNRREFQYYTVRVNEGFPPTDAGFYHLTGNVAEMIAEHGHTKGGSWYSTGGYTFIHGMDEYEGFEKPSPMIGFRVFMEVIEK